jgi:hypothetical protein
VSLNHLPALFTCHLSDEANPALCGKLSVDAHVNSQSAGWLISFSLDAVNPHIVTHVIVVVGSVIFVARGFFGRTAAAAVSIRFAMVLAGLAALSWSVIGLYLLHHATDEQLSHTTLPWAQFWLLDHIRATLGRAALGILICVLASPALYRRRASGMPASNRSLEPTAGRSDV